MDVMNAMSAHESDCDPVIDSSRRVVDLVLDNRELENGSGWNGHVIDVPRYERLLEDAMEMGLGAHVRENALIVSRVEAHESRLGAFDSFLDRR